MIIAIAFFFISMISQYTVLTNQNIKLEEKNNLANIKQEINDNYTENIRKMSDYVSNNENNSYNINKYKKILVNTCNYQYVKIKKCIISYKTGKLRSDDILNLASTVEDSSYLPISLNRYCNAFIGYYNQNFSGDTKIKEKSIKKILMYSDGTTNFQNVKSLAVQQTNSGFYSYILKEKKNLPNLPSALDDNLYTASNFSNYMYQTKIDYLSKFINNMDTATTGELSFSNNISIIPNNNILFDNISVNYVLVSNTSEVNFAIDQLIKIMIPKLKEVNELIEEVGSRGKILRIKQELDAGALTIPIDTELEYIFVDIYQKFLNTLAIFGKTDFASLEADFTVNSVNTTLIARVLNQSNMKLYISKYFVDYYDVTDVVNSTRIVTDVTGSKYQEIGDNIFKKDLSTPMTDEGKGHINPDDTISMDNATELNTFDINKITIVTSKAANKYFQMLGKIYRINPDTTITLTGKGLIDSDDTIVIDPNEVTETRIEAFDLDYVTKVITSASLKYFEKEQSSVKKIFRLNSNNTIVLMGNGFIDDEFTINLTTGTKIIAEYYSDKNAISSFYKDGTCEIKNRIVKETINLN
jgi:hypothetical protein